MRQKIQTSIILFLITAVSCGHKKCDCEYNKELLSEYQQTMNILIKEDTVTANKFSRVMEKLNTGE